MSTEAGGYREVIQRAGERIPLPEANDPEQARDFVLALDAKLLPLARNETLLNQNPAFKTKLVALLTALGSVRGYRQDNVSRMSGMPQEQIETIQQKLKELEEIEIISDETATVASAETAATDTSGAVDSGQLRGEGVSTASEAASNIEDILTYLPATHEPEGARQFQAVFATMLRRIQEGQQFAEDEDYAAAVKGAARTLHEVSQRIDEGFTAADIQALETAIWQIVHREKRTLSEQPERPSPELAAEPEIEPSPDNQRENVTPERDDANTNTGAARSGVDTQDAAPQANVTESGGEEVGLTTEQHEFLTQLSTNNIAAAAEIVKNLAKKEAKERLIDPIFSAITSGRVSGPNRAVLTPFNELYQLKYDIVDLKNREDIDDTEKRRIKESIRAQIDEKAVEFVAGLRDQLAVRYYDRRNRSFRDTNPGLFSDHTREPVAAGVVPNDGERTTEGLNEQKQRRVERMIEKFRDELGPRLESLVTERGDRAHYLRLDRYHEIVAEVGRIRDNDFTPTVQQLRSLHELDNEAIGIYHELKTALSEEEKESATSKRARRDQKQKELLKKRSQFLEDSFAMGAHTLESDKKEPEAHKSVARTDAVSRLEQLLPEDHAKLANLHALVNAEELWAKPQKRDNEGQQDINKRYAQYQEKRQDRLKAECQAKEYRQVLENNDRDTVPANYVDRFESVLPQKRRAEKNAAEAFLRTADSRSQSTTEVESLTAERGFGLEQISTEQAEEILQRTHINGDVFKGKYLTVDILKQNDLGPKYRLQIGESVVWFSSSMFSLDHNRSAVVAYVEQNGEVFARAFYQSGSQGVWRYLPAYLSSGQKPDGSASGIRWFSKGYDEQSVTLPAVLQRSLAELATRQGPPVSVDEPKFIVAGTAKRISSPDEQGQEYVDEINQEPEQLHENVYRHADERGQKKRVPPEKIELSEAQSPDFSRPIHTWQQHSQVYGEIIMETFSSHDGNLLYTFCRDDEGRAWVGHVEAADEIQSTGLKQKWVDAGDLTTPLFEYESQAGDYGVDSPSGYKDMYERYHSKIPVIQEYLMSIEKRGSEVEQTPNAEAEPMTPEQVADKLKELNDQLRDALADVDNRIEELDDADDAPACAEERGRYAVEHGRATDLLRALETELQNAQALDKTDSTDDETKKKTLGEYVASRSDDVAYQLQKMHEAAEVLVDKATSAVAPARPDASGAQTEDVAEADLKIQYQKLRKQYHRAEKEYYAKLSQEGDGKKTARLLVRFMGIKYTPDELEELRKKYEESQKRYLAERLQQPDEDMADQDERQELARQFLLENKREELEAAYRTTGITPTYMQSTFFKRAALGAAGTAAILGPTNVVLAAMGAGMAARWGYGKYVDWRHTHLGDLEKNADGAARSQRPGELSALEQLRAQLQQQQRLQNDYRGAKTQAGLAGGLLGGGLEYRTGMFTDLWDQTVGVDVNPLNDWWTAGQETGPGDSAPDAAREGKTEIDGAREKSAEPGAGDGASEATDAPKDKPKGMAGDGRPDTAAAPDVPTTSAEAFSQLEAGTVYEIEPGDTPWDIAENQTNAPTLPVVKEISPEHLQKTIDTLYDQMQVDDALRHEVFPDNTQLDRVYPGDEVNLTRLNELLGETAHENGWLQTQSTGTDSVVPPSEATSAGTSGGETTSAAAESGVDRVFDTNSLDYRREAPLPSGQYQYEAGASLPDITRAVAVQQVPGFSELTTAEQARVIQAVQNELSAPMLQHIGVPEGGVAALTAGDTLSVGPLIESIQDKVGLVSGEQIPPAALEKARAEVVQDVIRGKFLDELLAVKQIESNPTYTAIKDLDLHTIHEQFEDIKNSPHPHNAAAAYEYRWSDFVELHTAMQDWQRQFSPAPDTTFDELVTRVAKANLKESV